MSETNVRLQQLAIHLKRSLDFAAPEIWTLHIMEHLSAAFDLGRADAAAPTPSPKISDADMRAQLLANNWYVSSAGWARRGAESDGYTHSLHNAYATMRADVPPAEGRIEEMRRGM